MRSLVSPLLYLMLLLLTHPLSTTNDHPPRLTMKGAPADDAVICTSSQTFALRTITVSNSMLFLRPPQPSFSSTSCSTTTTSEPTTSHPASQPPEQTLLIQDTCHEILELTPTVPRLDRLERLLRDTAWTGMPGFGDNKDKDKGVSRGVKRSLNTGDDDDDDGNGNDDNDNDNAAIAKKEKKRRRYTRAQLQSLIQASDQELDEGLKARNVIQVDGGASLTRLSFPRFASPRLASSTFHVLHSWFHIPGSSPVSFLFPSFPDSFPRFLKNSQTHDSHAPFSYLPRADHLMHLPTRHLLPLLSTLLSLLTIHAINPTTLPRSITTNTARHVLTPSNDAAAEPRYAQAYPIAQDLSNDFSVSQDVAEGVMGVFGDLVRVVGEDAAAAVAAEGKAEAEGGVATTTTLDQSTVWRVQLSRLVNEVGKGLLSLESVSHLSPAFPVPSFDPCSPSADADSTPDLPGILDSSYD